MLGSKTVWFFLEYRETIWENWEGYPLIHGREGTRQVQGRAWAFYFSSINLWILLQGIVR